MQTHTKDRHRPLTAAPTGKPYTPYPRLSSRAKRLRLAAALFLLLAWLLGGSAALAQTWPRLDGVVSDDTGQLVADKVNSAAAELIALNVKPLAVLSQRGRGSSDSGDFAFDAAQEYGLGTGGTAIDPNLFAIVVLLDKREATFLYGDSLKPIFDGGVADDIRETYLNPNLAEADYTQAFAQSFQQAAREIELYRNPPPTATPVPSVITNIDTGGLGNALLWCLGIGLALAVLGVGGPFLYRQRQQSQAAAARRRALQEQLVQARNVSADMITNLEFPPDPEEQLDYRFLALSLRQERPQQLEQITTQYKEIYKRLSEALNLFNNLNTAKPKTEAEMSATLAQYGRIQAEITYANGFIQHLTEVSKGVEEQISAAPGETDATKKAIAAATDALAKLAAAAPDLYAPQPERALHTSHVQLAQAQSALAAEPPLPLQAYDLAQASRTLAEGVLDAVNGLGAAYNTLLQVRTQLHEARTAGFKLPESDHSLNEALGILSDTASHLEAGDIEKFKETLAQGAEALEEARRVIGDTPALHAANSEALTQLLAEGQEVKAYIAEGAKAFDKVDEYAPTSWDDIRGNGTEAQRAADEAFTKWRRAIRLNALTADSPQDFTGVATLIEEIRDHLGHARELVTAIIERLKHLEESQRTAGAEINAAESDIAKGRGFIGQHDPDIGQQPVEALDRAEELLGRAKDEVGKGKPDWIEAVALARQANDLADKALAGARSEQERMEAMRLKLQTAAQQAEAALSRAQNFAVAHRPDMEPTVFEAVKAAKRQMGEAQSIAKEGQMEGLEDTELGQSLDRAAEAFLAAHGMADQAFNSATTRFTLMEGLRGEAREATGRAESKINDVEAFLGEHSSAISTYSWSLLQAAANSLPQSLDYTDPAGLQAVIQAAHQSRDKAAAAYSYAQQEVEAYKAEQRRRNAAATSVIIGSVLSGSSSSRSSIFGGGSSSSRGGSSSGGWGSGGSSSGSFGGGGSSGGSWGGGGSSSGGW